MAKHARVPASSDAAHRPRGFRADVEGLRAVAVLAVLWFHARLPGLGGGFAGVDIFFVISGFLITGQLVREVERTGTVSLPDFYARRAKRLFPAAATVLLAAALITALALPRVQLRTFGTDIAAAAAYLINWRLAARSVDYLAEDVGASPVQHFWSLAVEEQFYIVWPLLILALAVLIRRRGMSARRGLAAGLALITIPSFAWSVYLTANDPPPAYFVTTTRLWELGMGALVALGARRWDAIRPRLGMALGWAGLALLALGLVVQDTATAWPGAAALVPTLGAALVIVGGFNAGSRGPVAILGRALPVWIGALSYSLYLWHWPLVVLADDLSDSSDGWARLACVAAIVPAWATHRFIENPVRFHPRVAASTRNALVLGLACSVLGVLAGGGAAATSGIYQVRVGTAGEALGGRATAPVSTTQPSQLGSTSGSASASASPSGSITVDPDPQWVYPDPKLATADVPASDRDKCTSGVTSHSVRVCDYGDTTSDTVVAAIGDSKLAQWLPALDRIGKAEHWRIRLYTKSACAWTSALTALEEVPNRTCQAWGTRVLAKVLKERPVAVLTSSLRADAYAGAERTQQALVDGYVDYWSRLAKAGIPVIAIADTPLPADVVYDCVLGHPTDFMTSCDFPYAEGRGTAALRAAAQRVPTTRSLDFTDLTCPGGQTCVPVVGNVLVYRQGSHITATYADSLTDAIRPRLVGALAQARKQARDQAG